MAKLIYSSIGSLDGYVADQEGKFDWAEPDEDVHTLVNDLQRPVGTFLLGRRMYEVLVAWETIETADQPPVIQEFRRDLALGRQDRVLQDLGGGLQRQDYDRAGVRSRHDQAAESVGGT